MHEWHTPLAQIGQAGGQAELEVHVWLHASAPTQSFTPFTLSSAQ
jgi:hypothetical protein